MDDLLDKIKEIYDITLDITGAGENDKLLLARIQHICEQILIDHQTQQALKRLEDET